MTKPHNSSSSDGASAPDVPLHHLQVRAQRSRLRLSEAALEVFAEYGFDGATFKRIAALAGVSDGLACRYFPTKEAMALEVYARNAAELEHWIPEMPDGTVAERFAATMNAKLATLQQNRRAITALVIHALDPERSSHALGNGARSTRDRFAAIFSVAVLGATDAPAPEDAPRIARMLYALHLLLILLWTQDQTPNSSMTAKAVKMATTAWSMLGQAWIQRDAPWVAQVDAMVAATVETAEPGRDDGVADAVLAVLAQGPASATAVAPVHAAAAALHRPHLARAIHENQAITLVLPGFPGKGPEGQLGRRNLPDLAEWLTLQALSSRLNKMADLHPPGAELILCGSGHVLGPSLGLGDADVASYWRGLSEMVGQLNDKRIRLWHLGDAFGDKPRDARELLLKRYGRPASQVRAACQATPVRARQLAATQANLHHLDGSADHAVECLRASWAWDALLRAAFPSSVFLSLEPQPAVCDQLALHLLQAEEVGLPPWQGVVMIEAGGARLVRSSNAQAAGARKAADAAGRPFLVRGDV